MARALAHIETIKEINPIIGADNIEMATVLGWKVIAKKGEFKVGDKCVYFEIDSLLPKRPWSEFMENKKYKVKTMKLSKFGENCFSQGLALPFDLFVNEKYYSKLVNANIGDDVTDIIGVKYYVAEDNTRKASRVATPFDTRFNRMMVRHPRLAKNKLVRKMAKSKTGKKILYFLFGSNTKDADKKFPSHFEFVNKTDETRCLVAHTKIETSDGEKFISDIVNNKLDVKVKSYNLETNEFEYKDILDYQKFDAEPLKKITYIKVANLNNRNSLTSQNSNSVICSKDHRLLTNNGYKRADEITLDDELMFVTKSYPDIAMQALYGMAIGDGYLSFDKRCNSSARITFTQGEDQKDYLLEKLRLLGDYSPKLRKQNSGWNKDKAVYAAHTSADRNLTKCLYEDKAIIDGRLIKTKEFCSRLTPLSLALWYLDDGCLRHRDDGMAINIEFSTYSETLDEVENLRNVLLKYGIESSRYEGHKHGEFLGYTIRLTKDASEKFLALVTEFIPYSMRYKTTKKLENIPYTLENVVFEKEEVLIPSSIISITDERPRPLYDIEVAGNHNFISDGVVSHNCENIGDALFEHKEEFIQTVKLDGTSSTYILERKPRGKYEFYVCSRNVRMRDQNEQCYHNDNGYGESNVYWDMAFKYHIRECLEDLLNKHKDWKYVCIQGESVGEGIQKNPHKLKGVQLFAFNFIDSVNGRWNSVDAKNLLAEYGINFVPIVNEHYTLPADMESLKLEADGDLGEYLEGAKGLREGFVYRSLDGKKSFKNVSRVYLSKLKD